MPDEPEATKIVPSVASSPMPSSHSEATEWKTYQDPIWNLSISYPKEWKLFVNEQGPPKLFISIFDQIAQDEFAQGSLDIVKGAIIQFSLTSFSEELKNPEQVLRVRIEVFDPKKPGLFYDPDGTLIVESYETPHRIKGLRGSAQSSVVMHKSFVFHQTIQDGSVMGVIELIIFRPLDLEREDASINIFNQFIDNLHFNATQ